MSIAKAIREAELQARVHTLEARLAVLEQRVDELLRRQVQELLAKRRRTKDEEVTT
jgi:uncharacterized protein YceH (UPF0502 family)